MGSIINFIRDKVGMQGFVTWLAACMLVVMGCLKMYQGQQEFGWLLISAGMGLVGLGRKVDATRKSLENKNDKS
ncbi:MAG: hypothetical protein RBR32_11530 [Bacteroidales bacterium]|nr:hypothetical protein [Bacteroidales bacterium]